MKFNALTINYKRYFQELNIQNGSNKDAAEHTILICIKKYNHEYTNININVLNNLRGGSPIFISYILNKTTNETVIHLDNYSNIYLVDDEYFKDYFNPPT